MTPEQARLEQLLLLVPALPIASALFLAFFGRKIPRLAGWIATLSVALALAAALPAIHAAFAPGAHGAHGAVTAVAWPFIATPSLSIDIAFRVDALSALMLCVVLGVGSLIHLYSIEYMEKDPDVVRYFTYLNMFIAFMLLLVLGDNLFLLFVGWEGVGLASYCLIGFWYKETAPPKAGMKAFITNRIGDFGFMIGMFLLAMACGTGNFESIAAACRGDLAAERIMIAGYSVPYLELVAILLFLGACGKSAQFPLHVWLPDAMEGPTPVSALIHAATMVTAGIYMVARLDPVFVTAVHAREIMLTIAVITAVGAAIAAITQFDLKRILAYSTISQLGYMMAGVAAGGREAAAFHLATHAVFKALLFLGAGSVMHALHGKLDIREMGGLIRRIPATAVFFIIGAFGLAGIPFFAGFYSKDLVLMVVAEHHPVHAAFLLGGAAITAFYSARMVMVAFFGKERLDHHTAQHCHESGLRVLVPLGILAAGTIVVGHIDIPHVLGLAAHPHVGWVYPAALATALGGTAVGWFVYRNRVPVDTPASAFIRSGFGLDALYARLFINPLLAAARWTRDVVDASGIDSIAHGLAMMGGGLGESMRSFQTGNLGTYIGYLAFGVAVLVWYVLG